MKKILTAEQMYNCDENTISSGISSRELMEKAAQSVVNVAISNFCVDRVIAVCGVGNNGGDGVVVAIILNKSGYKCDIYLTDEKTKATAETLQRINEAEQCGVSFVENPDFSSYSLIIDAILGIGTSRSVSEEMSNLFDTINNSGVKILSVDIASGLVADTGLASGNAIIADATVAIQSYKFAHLLADGIDASGDVYCCDIGVNTDDVSDCPFVMEKDDLKIIPKRKRNTFKGDFGRVLIVGGSVGMSGPVYFSALAAYKCGAGVVTIYTPEENREILQTMLPEAIVIPYNLEKPNIKDLLFEVSKSSVIVIGPGMGITQESSMMIREVFGNADVPLIVDADALTLCALDLIGLPSDVPIIVTPHPGEMSKLLGTKLKNVLASPIEIAKKYAEECDVICMLKTARTVITDGKSVIINTSGGPELAKGGSGDTLTGIIAGLICNNVTPFEAASLAPYIHGLAGNAVKEKIGDLSPLAREVIDEIPTILKNR